MGMSAGQARLLSITARLTDNELRSQMITNSKLRLADRSSEASEKYMDALNSQQLMYGSYSSDGSLSYQELTPNILLSYGDLKNQYSLVNSSGQIMLNGSDIKKYEASNSLSEFLYSYGIPAVDNPKYPEALMDIYGKTTTTGGSYLYEDLYDEENPMYWSDYLSKLSEDGTKSDGTYIGNIAEIETIIAKDAHELTDADANRVNAIVGAWKTDVTSKDGGILANYADIGGSFGKYVTELLTLIPQFPNESDYLSNEGTRLATSFNIASKPCYQNAINRDRAGCYIHVLAHLLDLHSSDITDTFFSKPTVSTSWGNTYSNTLGTGTITTSVGNITGSAIQSSGLTNSMAPVSEFLCADDDGDGAADVLAPAKGPTITGASSEVDKLLSNYKINSSGEMVQKTFKEKIIDLYYVVENRSALGIAYNDLKQYLVDFQTDMEDTLNTVTEEYYEAIDYWKKGIENWLENIKELKDAYIVDVENIPDKQIPDETDSRYQWYVNLYYRMGGGVENADGTKNSNNYKELDENLINNSDWLQFALEHGILTMEQAIFSENGSKKYPEIGTFDWVSLIYTNASDLKSQDDEVAIARAEVVYKNEMQEIENQDKKYDQDLKKLDTEHSALQTEYESLKSTIDKNVERSFKTFS